MSYNKYSANDIADLNKNKLWYGKPITIKEYTKINETKYILHATGDCDLNGRKYIALPDSINSKDSDIKQKYHLM